MKDLVGIVFLAVFSPNICADSGQVPSKYGATPYAYCKQERTQLENAFNNSTGACQNKLHSAANVCRNEYGSNCVSKFYPVPDFGKGVYPSAKTYAFWQGSNALSLGDLVESYTKVKAEKIAQFCIEPGEKREIERYSVLHAKVSNCLMRSMFQAIVDECKSVQTARSSNLDSNFRPPYHQTWVCLDRNVKNMANYVSTGRFPAVAFEGVSTFKMNNQPWKSVAEIRP